ncbi:MAG: EamA family transporter [Chthoniobacteraceae bacterium]
MPVSTALIVLPLLGAFVFTISALLLKRASDFGAGLWRTAFVSNCVCAAIFSSLLAFGGPPVRWDLMWQPACVALCLFAGMLSQFLALEKGDVSVAVPVLGLKVIAVALMTPLLTNDHIDSRLWAAVLLSAVGIVVLNRKQDGRRPHNVGITLLAAGFAAAVFGLFDVLVQKWGPAWGAGRLLPIVYAMNGVLSLALIPKFRAPLSALPSAAWKWLIPATCALGVQSILFVGAITVYGKATIANVIYSARGLMSILAVWLVGHWFSNAEQGLGRRTLAWRLLGAALMLSAIILVVTR